MRIPGLRKTTLGIDVGSGLIKIVVIDHGRGDPELVKVSIMSTPADAIVNGAVAESVILAGAIRDALDAAGSKASCNVAAVGGRDVIIKKIRTERVGLERARDLLRCEAEQHVPDFESAEFDFQILQTDPTADEMDVLLAAARRSLLDARVRMLTDAGLTPGIIDVDALALHNALEVNYPDAMLGFVSLVNVGHRATSVTLVENGVPVLTRDLAVGTCQFSGDLRRLYGLSAPEAENQVRGYKRTLELDRVLSNHVDEIASELERAAAYLTGGGRAEQLRSLYICGGGSRTPGLDDSLARRLAIKVEHANPLARLNISEGAFELHAPEDVAPLLMLPIGLALRNSHA